MSIRRLFLLLLVAIAFLLATGTQTTSLISNGNPENTVGLVAGRNVNMVSGTEWPGGDPWLQRQNEPSIAVSTRNPLHLLAGANDYRSIDAYKADELPGYEKESSARDAWLGVFKSYDGGQSWKSTLLPGYWLDPSEESALSPLNGYEAAADPVVRAGTNGLFYYSGITFNRGQRGLGKVFVARFIDNNNKETGAIEYINTKIIDVGNSGHFIDKPCIVVDIPRVGNEMTTLPNGQMVPCGNVYIVYTSFMGDLAEGDAHSKMMFSMSTDCGENWSKPTQITDSGQPYQAATLAINPIDGRLFVAYRRFFKDKTDAIMLCWAEKKGKETVEGYWAGKIKFSKPIVLAEIDPYDQPTSEITFRTNDYPTMTIDKDGVIYVAWSQRGEGPQGEGKIMMMTSADDGVTWAGPALVDDPALSGYEFMPSLTSGAGKVMMLWYDQQYDVSGHFDDEYIQEIYQIRHTIDVRAAEVFSTPTPYFSLETIQVSRYPWVLTFDDPENPGAVQLQHNMPNLRIFGGGTVPFFGDYIDISPSPMFVPDGNNGWAYNTDPASKPVYHAVWTDNRDVRPPGPSGNWIDYIAPKGQECDSIQVDQTGIRNQNIYTSRITEGIIAGSPGNTKPLNINRAFVVFVKNTTGVEKILRLEIDEVNSEGTANFYKAGVSVGTELQVTVLPYSSVSATVMVDKSPLNEYATVRINVYDGLTLLTYILLNPDSTNPGIAPHEGWDPDTPHVGSDETRTPHVGSRDVINWDYSIDSPHVGSGETTSPHVGSNRDWVTPHVGSGDEIRTGSTIHVGTNDHIIMSNIVNPHVGSDGFPRSIPENSSMTDVVWTVENRGNTTSTYSLSTFPFTEYDSDEIAVQLIVYKVYTTPTALGCELFEQEHHELILSQTSPHVGSGRRSDTASIASQSGPDQWYFDATFSIPPKGEEGEEEVTYKVILRYMDKDTTDDIELDPEDQGIFVDAEAPEIINGDVLLPVTALVITTRTQDLDNGTVGTPYNETLEVEGGYGNGTYAWSLAGDAANWLSIVGTPTSNICNVSGTPTTPGTYQLTVNVESTDPDYGRPTLTATKTLSIRIFELLVITTTPGQLPTGMVCTEHNITLGGAGGIEPYTWNVISGSLPDGLSLDENSGEISGTPTQEGTFNFTIQVTDSGSPSQNETVALSITITLPEVGSFSDTGNMLEARRDHTATLLTNGKVLIVGWSTQQARLYNPDTGTFIDAGQTLFAHSQGSTATRLLDGRVLIVGGNDYLTSAEIYDPTDGGSFTATGSLNEVHSYHTATLLPDGMVLIAAGQYNTETGPQTHAFAELYNPETGNFTLTGSLNEHRSGHTASLLSDGKVLITGGTQTTTAGYGIALDSAELYDPATWSFSLTDSMTERRNGHTATLLSDGQVLVAGDTSITSAELYDPVAESFSLTGEMIQPRGSHTATLLPNGLVLIAGGYIASGPVTTSSAELYNPETGCFFSTGNMSTARQQHTSTLLNNGQVLLAGGWDGTTETNSAELYIPGLIASATDPNEDAILDGKDFMSIDLYKIGNNLKTEIRFYDTINITYPFFYYFSIDENPVADFLVKCWDNTFTVYRGVGLNSGVYTISVYTGTPIVAGDTYTLVFPWTALETYEFGSVATAELWLYSMDGTDRLPDSGYITINW